MPYMCALYLPFATRERGVPGHRIGHRPSFRGHSTYRRGLPRRRGTDAPHRLWIGVLRGREVSGSTRGAGTTVTAGEVPQLKVVSGRHSDTRKRPVRSGAPWLTRRRCSTTQALPFVYPPSKSLCFTPGGGEATPRGRACILVSSNFGCAIAIMIRDSAFRRHLIADCCYC